MLLLAIDSSQRTGTVTLAEATEAGVRTLGNSLVEGGTFSAQLVPTIQGLLQSAHKTKSDIGALVAANGPGSFTGLRIGLAAVKAFAEILRQPIVAVSSLEALAAASAQQGGLLALIDAGRGECFCGAYTRTPSLLECQREFLASREEVLVMLRDTLRDGASAVTADAGLAEWLLSSNIRAEVVDSATLGAALARRGFELLNASKVVGALELDAHYLRRDESLFSPNGD